ncbi:MAG: hypothetical protein IJZ15_03315 [Oscillospiraceae bacterium]|nr:hypothetical protein [Oscillospiraceae bacterium]
MEMNQIKNSPEMENVASSKKAVMLFGAFCAGGLILLMISALLANIDSVSNGIGVLFFLAGYGVIAAPCLCAFIFKFGAFVEVGPVFTTYNTQIGDFIYQRVQRDYASEAGMNLVFTLLKVGIMFLISLILTPIITVVLFIIYSKNHKKAEKFAEENGVDKSVIPCISKTLVLAVVGILAVLLVATIIASAISDAASDKKRDREHTGYQKALAAAVQNLPEEYYADALHINNETGGFIAEFELDGETVYYGKISTNFSLVDGLYSGSVYFIIDDVLYVDLVGGGYEATSFKVSEDAEAKEYALGRHISQNVGKGATLIGGEPHNDTSLLKIEYQGSEYYIYVDGDNKLVKTMIPYDASKKEHFDMPETAFVIDADFDLTAAKAIAAQLAG